jgi:predicted nucleic acid-binding protein
MYVVDASVWVSRFVAPDVFHQPSFRWLEDYLSAGEVAVAPTILLVEVAGAVARRTGLPSEGLRAASTIQRLPHSRLVPVQAALVQRSVQLAAERGIPGADALYVALAHRLGLPLVTWDRRQRAQDGHGIIVLTPQEALMGG